MPYYNYWIYSWGVNCIFLKLLDLKTSHFKIQIHKGQFFKDTFPINTFPYVWLVKLLRAVKKFIHDFSSALCRRRFKQRSKGTCAKVAELTTFFRWKLTTYPKDGAQRACASQNVQSCACADHSGTSSYKLPVNSCQHIRLNWWITLFKANLKIKNIQNQW